MSKLKKDGKYLHCYIKSDIMKDLENYCSDVGCSKTGVIERALKQYLEKEAVLRKSGKNE